MSCKSVEIILSPSNLIMMLPSRQRATTPASRYEAKANFGRATDTKGFLPVAKHEILVL